MRNLLSGTKPLFALIFILSSISLSYAQNDRQLPVFQGKKINNFSKQALDERFEKYDVFEIPTKGLSQLTQEKSNPKFDLRLGSKTWQMTLFESHLHSKNYVTRVMTENGIVTRPHQTNTVFKGYLGDNYDHEIRLTIAEGFVFGFVNDGENEYYIEPLRSHNSQANIDHFVLYKTSDVIASENATCGVIDVSSAEQQINTNILKSDDIACLEVELAQAIDYGMYERYGSIDDVNLYIDGIMNIVATKYDNEFAETLVILISERYIVDCMGCDPWTSSTDYNDIFPEFQSWGLSAAGFQNPFDLSSLWTTRNIGDGDSSGAVGVAVTSTVCTDVSMSIIEDFSSVFAEMVLVVTHELGHNFGCSHNFEFSDTNCNSNLQRNSLIMDPAVSDATEWSTGTEICTLPGGSVAAVNNHVATRTCLAACAGDVCETTAIDSVSIVNISDNSIELTWTDIVDIYEIRYRPYPSDAWTSINTTSTNTWTITGLLCGTEYEIHVRPSCGNMRYGPRTRIIAQTDGISIDALTTVNCGDGLYDLEVVLGTGGTSAGGTFDLTVNGNTSTQTYTGTNPQTIVITDLPANGIASAIVSATDSLCTKTATYTIPREECVCTPIQTENFDACTLPPGWTNVATGSNSAADWEFGLTNYGLNTTLGNFDGTCMVFFDDDAYDEDGGESMVLTSPVVDLRGYDDITLEFDYNFWPYDGGYFAVDVFDGSTWVNVLYETGFACGDFGACTPPHAVIPLDNYANANFQVAFTYDDGDAWQWLAAFDNFNICGYQNECFVTNPNFTVCVGDELDYDLTQLDTVINTFGATVTWYDGRPSSGIFIPLIPATSIDLGSIGDLWAITAGDGCAQEIQITYNILDIVIGITSSVDTVCVGGIVNLCIDEPNLPADVIPNIEWTDDSGNSVGNTSCITVNPINETTYTAIYNIDQCADTAQITIATIASGLPPITYEAAICEYQNITGHDLTQYNDILGNESDVVNWYEGQPSLNGVNITAMADSFDLSNMPDIWANVIDAATNCPQEVDFNYEFDYAPQLTCPADITVDSDPDACGAFVNVPLVGLTDDNVAPFSNQSIIQSYDQYNETLRFDFTGYGLIDISQPATLTVDITAEIEFNNEYFNIFDENGNFLVQLGPTGEYCGSASANITISAMDLADFLTDGVMTFSADPSSGVSVFCPVSQVEMTLDYAATGVAYNFVQNSYNANGADASDFYYPGTTEVVYTVEDACGSTDTCSIQITVNPGTTTNEYGINASSESVCPGGAVQLCLNAFDTLPGSIYGLQLEGSDDSQDIYSWNIDETNAGLLTDNNFMGADIGTRTLGFDQNPVDGSIYMLAFADNNNLIRNLYTIDLLTGILTDLGQLISSTGNDRPQDITFDNIGNLYTIFLDGELHAVDYTDPALTTTYVATMPLIGAASGLGLTYNFDNNTLIYTNAIDNFTVGINQITTSGLVTPLTTYSSGCKGQGIEYAGQNHVYLTGTDCNFISYVNLSNGNTTNTGYFFPNISFGDLMYVPAPPDGNVLWTDETGNTLDTTKCIVVNPTITTTYSTTYVTPNGCTDISQITIEAASALPNTTLNIGVCEYEDITLLDLTQYNSFITSNINNVVEWYIGQPSSGGTNITATADSTDISNMPDLWAFVSDGISQCTQEIDITYETDYSPTITCPPSITVDNDPDVCGAFVTVPLATAIDDGITPVAGEQRIFRAYDTYGQILEFDFDGSNIDLSQPVSLLIEAAGDLRYSSEYYTIRDENGNFLLEIGNIGLSCSSTTATYSFLPTEAALLFADNSLMLSAIASPNVSTNCNIENEGVIISLLYTPITPEYFNISNDYNDGGADASDFYPNGTTSVTFTATDVCGNADVCTIDITVNQDTLQGEDFYFVACGDLVNYDLTQLNEYFEGTINEPTIPVWYEGQPSANGIEIDVATNLIDLTNTPDIWVLVLNSDTECHTEIQVTYGLDMTPQITCPDAIVVNANPAQCGAQVTVPLATAIDDNFSPTRSQQSFLHESFVDETTLSFTFDASNIDPSAPIDINSVATANLYYNRFFFIYDEGFNFIGTVGYGSYNQCATATDEITLPTNNLASYLADGTLTIFAVSDNVDAADCQESSLLMTIAYDGIIPDYFNITNDYTPYGADASGFYPSGTTVVTYTAVDSCGNASVCSTTITVNQVPTSGTAFNTTLCGPADAIDLAQIYDALLANPSDEVSWFLGQPSTGGTDITDSSNTVDLTSMPSLWAIIYDGISNCPEEREIIYELDTPPILNCPDNISVAADSALCGAQVTVPLATALDDNVIAFPNNLTIRQEYISYNQDLHFDFSYNGSISNIDTSQLITLTAIGFGELSSSSERFDIYDENNSYLGQVGDNFTNDCVPEIEVFIISPTDFVDYIADGVISFTGNPYFIGIGACEEDYLEMTLSFSTFATEYTSITNDYTDSGADASGYYPPGTTTVSFFAIDGCGNTDTCTVDVTVDLDVPVLEDFNFTACGDLENYDLTQYQDEIMFIANMNDPSMLHWYEGQPSMNGVDISAEADSADLTALPDLWAFITADTTNCPQEIHLTYQFDYPPEITCPTDITVDADVGECGAMVTIPLATVTDDNVQPIASQTIFDRLLTTSGQILYFDFDASNIDTLQPVMVTATGFGFLQSPFDYYRLRDENGDELGQITGTGVTCGVTPPYTFLISSDNWATWLADGILSFSAIELSVDVICPVNGLELTLSYTPISTEYVQITNNYNEGGVDASGFYPSGTTTVTYTATDGCGNIDICSFNITVNPGMTTDAMQIESYTDTICAGGEVELCLVSNEVPGALYALSTTNIQGSDIARYFINSADGQLTLDNTFIGADFDMDDGFIGFDINPVDGLIYLMTRVANYYSKLYTIDLNTGVVNDLGQVTSACCEPPSSFTFDDSGNLYYTQNNSLRLLDYTASPPVNTNVAIISSDFASGLTYNFDNNTLLYSAGYGNYIYLYEYDVNVNTNTLLVGPFNVPAGGGNQCSAKAIEYMGNGLVYAGDGAGCDKIYAIDINTNVVSPLLERTDSYSRLADLLYFSPFDLGTTVWTDGAGNDLGIGECISVTPNATSTYTATYTGDDTGCVDVSEITIQVATESASTTLDIGICDPISLTNFDWTQYDTQLVNDSNESVEWYIGQPSMGGTNITATANSTDLTNTPDIWALITNNLSACTQEVAVSYQLDMPPLLVCPAAITVNNDLDTCGAYVTVPMPVLTDDLLTLAEPVQTITQEIVDYGSLYFNFDATNIDPSQEAVLTVNVMGNTRYSYEDFTIYDDSNNSLGEVGNDFDADCVLETRVFNISASNLATYAADGVINFRASPSSVEPGFCDENYVSMTLSYTALIDEYIYIENNYTDNGTDASAYYPPGTTTVTYIVTDGCGKSDTCSVDITVNQAILSGEDFDFVACGDLENYDLTEYNNIFTGYTPVTGKIAEWYDGQPSANGSNIDTTAYATDLTTIPDLWVLVTDTFINCAEEINVNYAFDFAPTITCPASITANNEPDTCGAFVTLPLATATDDNATPLPGEQSIFIDYLNEGDTLQFDFDATNIDTTQAITLIVNAYGNLYFYNSGNYSIYNEGNDLMGTLTSFSTCGSDIENYTLPDSLDTFTEDGVLSFTAIPANVGIGCTIEGVWMILRYTPIVPEYVQITNSHNSGGADASGFYNAGTTTVTYIAYDACGNTDTCMVDIIIQQDTLQGDAFDFTACGDLSAYDLTELDDDLSNYGQSVTWYEGQPTIGGTALSANADSINLTSMPDIWAVVTDTLINCPIEIDVSYTFDYPPVITCPTNITVDADTDTCGAFITIPLAMATDDNVTAFPAEQSILINHTENEQVMSFAFDASNINMSQPATLHFEALGELNNSIEYYDIFNENDSLMIQFGSEFGFFDCAPAYGELTISATDLAAFAANDTITFTAIPTTYIYPYYCFDNYMEMTLSYTPLTPEYIVISNDQNDGGADASGFYPSGTTTVTYTASDACGNVVTCTTDVTVNQPVITGETVSVIICGGETTSDLTQLEGSLISTPEDAILWFLGQPSNGGTDITDMAQAYDLSTSPELWVQVIDGISGCITERDVDYQVDTPLTITCPANITVDSDDNTCGAEVSLDMVTVTDDGLTPLPQEQTILQNYTSSGQVLQFDFNTTNILTSQPATLTVTAYGDLGSSFEYFDIGDEGNNTIGLVGDNLPIDCQVETETFVISAVDLTAYATGGTLTFTASPSNVETFYCAENYVEMTLSYTPLTGSNTYSVVNSYNDGGADASGFYPPGTTPVTFIAADGCGNTDTCTVEITVNQGATTQAFNIFASADTVCTGGTAELCLGIPPETSELYALFRGTFAAEVRRFEADPNTYLLTPDDEFEGSSTSEKPYAFDYNPSDETFYLLASRFNNTDFRHLYTFDLTTGIIEDLGQMVSSTGTNRPQSMAFDDAGNLYAVFIGGTINQINYSTTPLSATEIVSGLPFSGDVGLTYNFDNHSLLYTTGDNPSTQLHEVSLDSQTANLLMTFTTPNGGSSCGAQGIEYIGDGIVYGTGRCNEFFTIDINNQSLTPLLNLGGSSTTFFKDLLYVSALPSSVIWTDDAGSTLDTVSCISVTPISTTTYTATYTPSNGCPNVSEITIVVPDSDSPSEITNVAFCASDTTGGIDLTNYNAEIISGTNDVVSWYIGQPSTAGTDIADNVIDVSNSPDIWALVLDTLTNCSQEIQIDYLIDQKPILSCPDPITLDVQFCGAYVTIPPATATDDNLILLSNEKQSLTQDYVSYNQNLIFDFDGANIDVGQPLELTISIVARMSFQNDYFNIFDENGSLIGRVGNQSYSQTCPQAEETFTISTADLGTFLSDGVLSITVDPYFVSTSFCTSTVEISIDYAAIVPTQYVEITNDQNNGGADASGYYPSGITEVTFFATDACGNIDTCTTTVTVDQMFVDSYTRTLTFCGDSTAMDLTQANSIITSDPQDVITWYIGQPSIDGIPIDGDPTAYDLSGLPDIWAQVSEYNTLCIFQTQLLYEIDNPPIISCPASVSVDAAAGECSAFVSLSSATATDDNVLALEPVQTIFQAYTGVESALEFGFDGINIDPAQSATLTVRGFGNLEGTDRYYDIFDETGNLIGTVGNYFGSADCETATNTFLLSPSDLAAYIADDNTLNLTAVPTDLVGVACDMDGVTMELVYTQLVNQYVSITNDHTNTADASGYYPSGTTVVTFTAMDGCGNISTCTVDVTVNQTSSAAILNAENTNLFEGDSTQICIEQDSTIQFEYIVWTSSLGDTISYGQDICIEVAPDVTSTYTATYQAEDGCLYEGSIVINVAIEPDSPFNITNSFFASDPCTCNADQTENGAGDGTFTETVTITGEPGLVIRASANSTGLSTGAPVNFYESFSGRYRLEFTHVDRVGYTIYAEVSYDGGVTFQPIFDAFGMPMSISNVCAYPVLDFVPSLIEFCETDGIISINVAETSDNVDFVLLPGYPSISINSGFQYPAPIDFDPWGLGGSIYTFTGYYNYENGTGTGGTLEMPAVSLNACPTFVRVNVPINQEPSGYATCQTIFQTGQVVIEIRHRVDYNIPENLLYRLEEGQFQIGPMFNVADDGQYDLTIMDTETACMYEFEVGCLVPLPIELTSFEAICDDGTYTLEWKTATEENVSEFVIERSVNGTDFTQLGKVTAAGNSTTPQYYTYRDETAQAGRYYYRLRIVETDGKETFSRIEVSTCLKGVFDIVDVFPNPTDDELVILFETVNTDKVNFKLTDVLGRTIMEEDITPEIGLNTKVIDLSELASAVYFVVMDDGKAVRKVVRK